MKIPTVCALTILSTILSGTVLGQDMRENVGRSLFSDQKANRQGDAVTILIVEISSASNDAKTSSSRESNLSLSGSMKTSNSPGTEVSGGLGLGNQFKGEGATASRGSIRAKISARVDSVLTNGNLVVNGNRTITVNGEEQTIKISGIVRPSDIQADNSVYSFNISDAVIVFEGSGIVSRAQGPGWFTKLLHWLL
jgi:flagellar L-ring protein precursor FlgH